VTPRNCIRVNTRQNIIKEFSREGRRGRNMRGVDWIRGTFRFEVIKRVSTLRLCLLVKMILRNGKIRGTAREVGEACVTRPIAKSCKFSFIG
jgi:hypothetical protein